MEIRKALTSDSLEAISRVYAASWQTAYRGIIPDDYLDALDALRWTDTLKASIDTLLLAVEAGEIIGVCTYGPARDAEYTGWGEVVSLYLLPDRRRQGVGSLLLSAALGELHMLGCAGVYLWVLEDNRFARRFYEKHGFAVSGDKLRDCIGGKDVNEVRYLLTSAK